MQPSEYTKQTPSCFRWVSPTVIEIREGGGCMSLFGVPFFLAGLFLIAASTGMIHVDNQPGGWEHLALVFMGVAFTAAGGVLVLGRRWLTLDAANRSALRQQGLLVPMRHEQRPLGEFNSVVIALETDSDSADKYPIRLRALTGKDLVVCSSTKYEESLEQAEFLARFLQLPLTDTITDNETVASPQHLGETLQQRLRSGALALGNPVRPAAMRCEVREEFGQTTIVIPGGKSWTVALVFLVSPVILIVFLGGMGRFFTRTQTPAPVQFFFMGFLALMFIVAPLVAVLNARMSAIRSRTTVTASSSGLLIERRGAWCTKAESIAAVDIVDLDVSTFQGTLESTRRTHPEAAASPVLKSPVFTWLASKLPTKGLIVKSRRGLVTFGDGLSREELEFLKWALLRGLT